MKRVVAIFGIEADFDIVFAPSVALKDFSNPVAEVALHFQNEAADPLFFVTCPVRKNLLCVWIHAAACLSGADCAENCDAREKTPFRDHEPLRVFCGRRLSRIVDLSEDEERVRCDWTWLETPVIFPLDRGGVFKVKM